MVDHFSYQFSCRLAEVVEFKLGFCVGNEKIVSVSYKNLIQELSVGDTILVNNGLVEFRVKEIIAISEALNLTLEEKEAIFFADKVDE